LHIAVHSTRLLAFIQLDVPAEKLDYYSTRKKSLGNKITHFSLLFTYAVIHCNNIHLNCCMICIIGLREACTHRHKQHNNHTNTHTQINTHKHKTLKTHTRTHTPTHTYKHTYKHTHTHCDTQTQHTHTHKLEIRRASAYRELIKTAHREFVIECTLRLPNRLI